MNTTTYPATEITPFEAMVMFPRIVEDYKDAATKLAEANARLADRDDDRLVGFDWVCEFFDIDRKTARLMLADSGVFCHGQKIKRFWKSEILAFARKNTVKLKQVKPE